MRRSGGSGAAAPRCRRWTGPPPCTRPRLWGEQPRRRCLAPCGQAWRRCTALRACRPPQGPPPPPAWRSPRLARAGPEAGTGSTAQANPYRRRVSTGWDLAAGGEPPLAEAVDGNRGGGRGRKQEADPNRRRCAAVSTQQQHQPSGGPGAPTGGSYVGCGGGARAAAASAASPPQARGMGVGALSRSSTSHPTSHRQTPIEAP